MKFGVEYSLKRLGMNASWVTKVESFPTLKEAAAAAVYNGRIYKTRAVVLLQLEEIEAAHLNLKGLVWRLGYVFSDFRTISAMTSGVPRSVRRLASELLKEFTILEKLAS